ncbi:hypothetical protein [Micrococcus luteus]|uniref:hypothetical protein n=1 Tax=Micrococcus luteus TaxID=1270 RepID=UPI000C7B05F5|nr:hypothetical protein [Micrococcus luteus]PLA45438.1 hypothetical protein CYJ93_11105 [Micrococcus luteus]
MQDLPESGSPRTNLAPRQVDLSQPAGHRVYIQAHALLGFAYEHHQAYRAYIDVVGFGPRAPFNLLRPVLESSLWVLWILDPQDSATRRRRALQYEIHDFKAEIAYLQELGKCSGGLPMREAAAHRQATAGKSYRDEAERMGLDYRELSRAPLNLTDEIPKMQRLLTRYDSDTARLIVAEWRRLSGYQHGKAWSVALGSDQSFVAKVPGGQIVHILASDNSISLATGLTAFVFIEALTLYIDRCETPIR